MDVKEAVAAAKKYLIEVYADEQVKNLGLEEVEHAPGTDNWAITLGFSQPWNTPRTRAQEVLETLEHFPINRKRSSIYFGEQLYPIRLNLRFNLIGCCSNSARSLEYSVIDYKREYQAG